MVLYIAGPKSVKQRRHTSTWSTLHARLPPTKLQEAHTHAHTHLTSCLEASAREACAHTHACTHITYATKGTTRRVHITYLNTTRRIDSPETIVQGGQGQQQQPASASRSSTSPGSLGSSEAGNRASGPWGGGAEAQGGGPRQNAADTLLQPRRALCNGSCTQQSSTREPSERVA